MGIQHPGNQVSVKYSLVIVLMAVLSLAAPRARATVYYVNQNCASPAPPYSDWSIAATNIQDAINAATNGDEVLVTNGVYAAGGLVMDSTGETNRVALNKPLTVQSVNGPFVTAIQGAVPTNGPLAVRCAWLTNGAALVGFTLQNGATVSSIGSSATMSGGGVWCAASNSVVANCMIVSNTAFAFGGAAYQGCLQNCLVTRNPPLSGGQVPSDAVDHSVMVNCTVVTNNSLRGVGAGTCTNCIIYYNYEANDVSGGTLAYCCTSQLQPGPGNITTAPDLFADNVHLLAGSPCIGKGAKVAAGTDIFGNAWASPPSMGCAEYQQVTLITRPQIQLQGIPAGFTAGGVSVAGESPFSFSWFKDGLPLSDNGHFSSTQTSNLVATGVSLADDGNYQLVVNSGWGTVTSAVATLTIHCVSAAGQNPVVPYTNWFTAATNIQDAVNTAAVGDVVLVTNGVYASGGASMDGVISNRIAINTGVMVASVGGPNLTVITGALDPATNGPAAVRCVWMTNNAILSGFTLTGGATDGSVLGQITADGEGGGIYCASSNCWVYNCIIATNYALTGGGIYGFVGFASQPRTTLSDCTLIGNQSGSGGFGGGGGGAYGCNLMNCRLTGNVVNSSSSEAEPYGGGGLLCHATNCVFSQNAAPSFGAALYMGTLVNCTVTGNGLASPNGSAAVADATLYNCIVYSNYANWYTGGEVFTSTFSYSCTTPLPSGTGNIDVNPQLLGDGIHLAAGSPCIGAGQAGTATGVDIDSQPWNNPPSMGCDEWQPAPVIALQPVFTLNPSANRTTVNVVAAGQAPFGCVWSLNCIPLQDDGHYFNSATPGLTINNFGPPDAGAYQVVVSNAFGVVTSQVAQVVVHAVNAAGINPVAPYLTWATAATNIQDAINAASAGDYVEVTNGLYQYGGAVMAGNLTNRVALYKPLTVFSVNGCSATAIQGAWDTTAASGLGPGAVRCAYVGAGAVLEGFTLQNGGTRATGDSGVGGPLESGGGVWCNSASAVVANCVLSNNVAVYGGGIIGGTLNNSLVTWNQAEGSGLGSLAAVGGGACPIRLNNCTVTCNFATGSGIAAQYGAGIYGGIAQNCIVINNYDSAGLVLDNYAPDTFVTALDYSCSSPLPLGTGNIDANPELLDQYHIAATSPCRGAGSASYSSGFDLDGEAWTNPPSMGCDEVVSANLNGPLSPSIDSFQPSVLVNRLAEFSGFYAGRASGLAWSFGDGQTQVNPGPGVSHQWTNSGTYTVSFTVYNNDNPGGVTATANIQVLPLNPAQLSAAAVSGNAFQFQFLAQTNANYTVQYTTNLVPPVAWSTLQSIFQGPGGVTTITDSVSPSGTRFYRILAQ